MGLLAVVNLVAVLLLIKVGLRIVRDYDEPRRAGIASRYSTRPSSRT